jgi:hypothetical protein
MTQEFIPYEQALALKELGFNEPCVAFYYGQLNRLEIGFNWTNEGCKNSLLEEIVSAPLYQQAFRWFREKYGIKHMIFAGKISTVFYGYDLLHIEEQEFVVNNSDNGGGDCDYTTYEEAELACLIKLIEIVKNK